MQCGRSIADVTHSKSSFDSSFDRRSIVCRSKRAFALGIAAVMTLELAPLCPAAVRFSDDTPPKTLPAPTDRRAEGRLDDRGDGLAASPLDGDLLGFTMRVPVGTNVRVERAPVANYLLSEAGEVPAWRLRVSALAASRAETTAKSQCKAYLDELRAKEQQFETLVDEPRTIAGKDAHLFYISVPLEGGERGVTGTLVVPNGPDNYLVFSILAVGAEFNRVRPLLDRCFDSLVLKDFREVAVERVDLLSRGNLLLSRFTPEVLRATVSEVPAYYRMWRPDPSGGQKDFGYVVVRVLEGKRGEVDASRDRSKLKGDDADSGLLATVDARVVVNDDPSHTIDVQSRYFMTWDRVSEGWSIRSTERQRRASRSSAQTGVRAAPSTGEPKQKIKVISATLDGLVREPHEWPMPPAYVSQAELIVLGQLLPHNIGTETLEFMDYAFDQRDEKLPQRRELWTKTNDGFRLETRFGSSPAKLVQEFDPKGRRVRRIDFDGTVTELIELEQLRRIWKSKGLPVD